MRLLSLIKNDIKFQVKHGFYQIYIVVTLLYIILLRIVEASFRSFIATTIIFSDPSVLGFFFIGGVVLLEKNQNIYQSIFVSPLKEEEYLISKVISFALISVISSLAIAFSINGFSFNIVLFMLGVLLTSAFFTLMGFILVSRTNTINEYLISSPLISILILPMLEFLKIYSSPIFNFFPAKASLNLIYGSFLGANNIQVILSIVNLVAWIIFAFLWARAWFNRFIVTRIGGGK